MLSCLCVSVELWLCAAVLDTILCVLGGGVGVD